MKGLKIKVIMLFFNKCTMYKEDKDLVIHEVVRVKNAFHFSIEDEDYGKTIIDILKRYCNYTKEEINKDLNNVLNFVKLVLGRELNMEDYEMFLLLNNYIEEMF